MTLNWDRALKYAAVAGTAVIAWKQLGPNTRDELRLRASCAASMLLGNPVAYRVLVLKDGDGPGFELHGGPATMSQCTVVGVRGDALHMTFPPPSPDAPDEDEDYAHLSAG